MVRQPADVVQRGRRPEFLRSTSLEFGSFLSNLLQIFFAVDTIGLVSIRALVDSSVRGRKPDEEPTISPEPTVFAGTTRYVVSKRLGSGGMGVVYQAHDVERKMDVALKVLLRLDADGIYRLKSEFRSLADVSHPNLVGLFELGSEGDQWFIAMELVEGVDLLSWVREAVEHERVRPEDDTVAAFGAPEPDRPDANVTLAMDEWTENAPAVPVHVTHSRQPPNLVRLRDAMRQLANAVRAIHVSGKLHRDIKPSNALVTVDGRLVMLDFGLVQEDASLLHLRDRRDSQGASAN